MKKLILFTALCFCSLTAYNQSSMSVMLGYNQNTQFYQAYSGVDLGLRYQIGLKEKIKYGVAAQYDHFLIDLAGVFTSSTSLISVGPFAEILPFKIKKIEPYISASLAPAFCVAKGEVDFIFFGTKEKINFIAGQFTAGIGSRFEISKTIQIQLDIKKVLNYSNKFDEDGFYNYASMQLGMNFKF